MNSARVFIICGDVQHGKTTLAKYLARAVKGGYRDCSDVIYETFARRAGMDVATARAMPKEAIRPQLITIGDELCAADPGFLAKRLYFGESVRVIAGIRRTAELESLIADVGVDSVVPVWIDRPGGPSIPDNTQAALRDMCPIHVVNSGMAHSLSDIAADIAVFQHIPKCRISISPPASEVLAAAPPKPKMPPNTLVREGGLLWGGE